MKSWSHCLLLATISLSTLVSMAAPSLRIMPLGDSITQGVGDAAGGGYRGPLWTLLKNARYNVDFVGSVTDTSCNLAGFDKHHEGHGGWRVDQTYGGNGLYEHINEWSAGCLTPHIVLLHIGTNDSGSNFTTILNRYEALLERIYECHPDTHVIATTLMWRKQAANMTNIESFNNGIADLVAAEKAKGRKISLVDMKAAVPGVATSTGSETGAPNFSDGLHPSAAGYQLMAKAWFDEITKLYPNPDNFDSENKPAVAYVSVKNLGGKDMLTVAFNQPVELTGASAPENWTISGATKKTGAPVSITDDQKSVLFTLDSPTPWSTITVTIPSVKNLYGTKTSVAVTKSVVYEMSEGAAANVPAKEFGKYTLVYDWNLPENIDTAAHMPNVNRAALIKKGGFKRVAYFMELKKIDGTYQYAWASMDAFTDEARKLDIPYQGCDFLFQQKVDNLLVYSNVAGLRTGIDIPQGNVEIWNRSYSTAAKLGGLGSDGSAPWKSNKYDWDDTAATANTYWGSLQVHDYVGKTTVLSYTGFTKDNEAGGLGIGNNPNWSSQSPDWTQTKNAASYSLRHLQVYVELNEPLKSDEELMDEVKTVVGDKADGYEIIYRLEMPAAKDKLTTVPYALDKSATYKKPYDRIGYFFRLVDANGNSQWAWTSMDSWTQNLDLIGVPNTAERSRNSFKVKNLEVESNVTGVETGTFADGGIVEFWKEGYDKGDSLNVGAANVYDFCDTRTSGDYGSMQINNYAAKQTVWAFNRWLQGNIPGMGIGNRPGATHLDWTEYSNATTYMVRDLYIAVRPQVAGATFPAPSQILANVDEAKDYDLLYQIEIPKNHGTSDDKTANQLLRPENYNAAHKVNNGAAFEGKTIARVAYYLELTSSAGTEWCWTSFDAPTQDLKLLSVPTDPMVATKRLQTQVANLTVRSNVSGVSARDRVATGNMEFWGGAYSKAGSASGSSVLGLPGANDSTYDFDDRESNGVWGCMQVHDYGKMQTLWAVNGFNRDAGTWNSFGIGNRSSGNPDWTQAQNGNNYSVRNLYVLVQTGEVRVAAVSARRVVPSLDGYKLCVEFADSVTNDIAAVGNYSLAGNTIVEAKINPRDNREVILTLGSKLEKGTTYTLTLKGQATRGNNAKYEQSLSFTTPDTAMPSCLTAPGAIPELRNYKLIYELNPPNAGCDYGRNGADYTTDETRFKDFPKFDRIAYLLYLKGTDGVEKWVWTSMDAFTKDATKIGVPGEQRDNHWQTYVNNLFVVSSANAPVCTGKIPQGNIEFFMGSYNANQGLGVPGGSGSINDFDDTDSSPNTGGDYTSMQVHDYLNKTTLWAINSLGRKNYRPGFGIGNYTGSNSSDWTFVENANEFVVRRLYVFIRNTGYLLVIFK